MEATCTLATKGCAVPTSMSHVQAAASLEVVVIPETTTSQMASSGLIRMKCSTFTRVLGLQGASSILMREATCGSQMVCHAVWGAVCAQLTAQACHHHCHGGRHHIHHSRLLQCLLQRHAHSGVNGIQNLGPTSASSLCSAWVVRPAHCCVLCCPPCRPPCYPIHRPLSNPPSHLLSHPPSRPLSNRPSRPFCLPPCLPPSPPPRYHNRHLHCPPHCPPWNLHQHLPCIHLCSLH
mmetsp:Transcript_57446/g.94989  ORF Transcript_57446/g.94989 Transcript_57446/m.94989 type:complete len:235 (+) Transcript_57446:547-1251(+)